MSEVNVIAINCNGDKRLILINSLSYKDVTKSASEEFNVKNIKFYTNETDIEITEKIFPFYLKQHIVNPAFILSMKAEIKAETKPANVSLDESESDEEMTNPLLLNTVKMIKNSSKSSSTPQQPNHINDSPSTSSSPHQFNKIDFQPFSIGVSSSIGIRDIKHVEDIRNIPDANIDIIFNYYKQRKTLGNKERILLCKTIVKYLLEIDPARILAKSEFASISQIIANCFRGEIASTYFIPAEHRSIAKGKLWNSYMNYRTQLSQAGLIKRRPRGIKPLVGGTTSALIIKTENDMDQDDDDLNFIRVETSPWEDVRKSWNNTFFSRMKFLNEYSTENYFNSFPCLKDEQGYELLKDDSTNLYPSIGSCITKWPKICKTILETSEKNKTVEVRNILASALTPDSKQIAGFLILPYLFPGKTTKGNNLEKSYRPTRIEIQRKFVVFYENKTDAEIEEEKLTDKLFELKKPRVTIIGETLNSLESIYVSFGETIYYFKNTLKAVEACFHIYTAFGIEYPQESNHLWLFLQKSVYEIETPNDLPNSLVETLINDLNHME